MCPYQFLLTYLSPSTRIHQFYADYGTFFHRILADFYTKFLPTPDAAVGDFIRNFFAEVKGTSPGDGIRNKFFIQGLDHLRNLVRPEIEICGVEKRIDFTVGDLPFTGFIDLLLRDDHGDFIIVDHKSHPLKQRSSRRKPTKADGELDLYLRQLYLYSVYLEQTYGVLPKSLVFNCYRTGTVIVEPFDGDAFQAAKEWALSTISTIRSNLDWSPSIEFFQCKYLCDVQHECDFYRIGVEK